MKTLLRELASKDLNIFHRTGRLEWTPTEMEAHIEKVKTGFIPSNGDAYGKGLYGADWGTQIKDKEAGMQLKYGPMVLHYVASSKGYLIFDYRLSKRLYGKNYSLEDQLIGCGAYTKKDLPVFLSVMSEDLEDTFTHPLMSANRAHLLAEFFYRGGHLSKGLKSLKPRPVGPVEQAYFMSAASFRKEPFNAKINTGIIKGVVFSGSNDGNVIVTFVPSFKKLLFIGWCVVDKGEITKPWEYVQGGSTAAGVNGKYQDGIAELLKNKHGKGVADILWCGNLTNGNVASAVKITLDRLRWLKEPLARFEKLEISVHPSGEVVIDSGKWLQGICRADEFAETDDMGGTSSIFAGGTFAGGRFGGIFLGGTFLKGEFQGIFAGGIYVLSRDTKWGRSAMVQRGIIKAISVGGKTYPWKVADSPEKEWEYIQSEQKAKISGMPDGIKDLPAYIQAKLGFECEIQIDSVWEKGLSNEQKYMKFKQAFPWLFIVRKLDGKPSIFLSKNKLFLRGGELVAGTVMFDEYDELVIINGGHIVGKNTFKGKFNGGIYSEGRFEGTFSGGLFDLDKAVWAGSAKASPPKNLETGFVYAVMYGGKRYNIPKDLLMYEEDGEKPYQDIGEILKVLKAGKWADVNVAASRSFLTAPGKSKNYRKGAKLGIGQQTDVLDWAVDDTGGSKAKFTAIENYIFKNAPMMGIIYESYLKEKNNNILSAAHVNMFSETFGYFGKGLAASMAETGEKDDDDDGSGGIDEALSEGDGYSVENLLRENLSSPPIFEKEFSMRDLSAQEQETLYLEFKNSYTKATGAAFSRDAFEWRADGWTFFGDPPDENNPTLPVGGIAVRKQMSNNMYKIVASFGNFRSVFKGFDEFRAKHGGSPAWAILTPNLAKMVTKHDKSFKHLPDLVVKAMEGAIKQFSNGEVKSVGINGVMKVDTPAGVMEKVFIANAAYIRWLLDSAADPKYASRLPVPQAALAPLISMIKALV